MACYCFEVFDADDYVDLFLDSVLLKVLDINRHGCVKRLFEYLCWVPG